MNLIQKIRNKAKEDLQKIVLPEANDPRVIKAATILKQEKLAEPVLLGNEAEIKKSASEHSVNIDGIQILDPAVSDKHEAFAEEYYQLRKHKGITKDQADEIVKQPLFFGALMLRAGEAAGAVAGSLSPTADVMRAAFQVVGMAEGIKAVSSSFIMVMPDGQALTFGDCAVIPNPNEQQLASIAVSSAKTHEGLVGTEPNVAMLSFSTKGSARHDLVDKVVEATEIARKKAPELKIDGELQVDAALVEAVGRKKARGSLVAGNANVLSYRPISHGINNADSYQS